MKTDKKRPHIDKDRCKGCMLCVDVCPRKILASSKDVNKRGQKYIIVTDPHKCTGCGMCVTICPDCAIKIADEE